MPWPIHWLQCADACRSHLWAADELRPEVDETRCHLLSPLPRCPRCEAVARPNILMFGDPAWVESRTDRQMTRLSNWLPGVQRPVVVELGAGRAIPTVRHFGERHGPRVIRINPLDHAIDPRHGVGIAGNALDVLVRLDAMLDQPDR